MTVVLDTCVVGGAGFAVVFAAVRVVRRVAVALVVLAGVVAAVSPDVAGGGALVSVVTLVSGVGAGSVVVAGGVSVGVGCACWANSGVEESANAAAIAAALVRK